jgi:hypothetical protein
VEERGSEDDESPFVGASIGEGFARASIAEAGFAARAVL